MSNRNKENLAQQNQPGQQGTQKPGQGGQQQQSNPKPGQGGQQQQGGFNPQR